MRKPLPTRTLAQRIRKRLKAEALSEITVIMRPCGKTLAVRGPASIVGYYDHRATTDQIEEDIAAAKACLHDDTLEGNEE